MSTLRSISLMLALIVTAGARPAAAADEIVSFLESSFKEALDVVYDPAPSADPLSVRLTTVVARHFDMEYATRSAVGRAGWEKLSEAQRKQAVELFTQLVLRTYADRFKPTASRPQVVFGASTRTGDRCEVPSQVTYEGQTFQVTYRLRLVNGAWRYYDIVAENISMLRNYREQFEAILNKSGPDGLMKSLEESVRRPPPVK